MKNVKSKICFVQILLLALSSKSQIITTIAGTGTYSYSGDGGAAVNSQLNQPKGVVLDPFAGSGSTLAAAESVGYESVGIEKDDEFFRLAKKAIPQLSKMTVA